MMGRLFDRDANHPGWSPGQGAKRLRGRIYLLLTNSRLDGAAAGVNCPGYEPDLHKFLHSPISKSQLANKIADFFYMPRDLKSLGCKAVPVRVRPPAPKPTSIEEWTPVLFTAIALCCAGRAVPFAMRDGELLQNSNLSCIKPLSLLSWRSLIKSIENC
jgi:hypothetical protein